MGEMYPKCQSDCPFFVATLEEVGGGLGERAKFKCMLAKSARYESTDPVNYRKMWYYWWLSKKPFIAQRDCILPDQRDVNGAIEIWSD